MRDQQVPSLQLQEEIHPLLPHPHLLAPQGQGWQTASWGSCQMILSLGSAPSSPLPSPCSINLLFLYTPTQPMLPASGPPSVPQQAHIWR